MFDGFAEGEAGEGTVGADHAVAGDDQTDGIGGVGAADGARGARVAEGCGESAVAAGFTVGNRDECGPDAVLKISAFGGERHREIAELSGEIRVNFFFYGKG